MKGSDAGPVIVPGDSGASILIDVVADEEMPPKGEGAPLTKGEVQLLRDWIDAGAPWAAAAPKPKPADEPVKPADESTEPVAPPARVRGEAQTGARDGEPEQAPAPSPLEEASSDRPPQRQQPDFAGSVLPPAAEQQIVFASDIQPILQRSCLKCHGPERPRSGFRLDNRVSALKGGRAGAAIIPGDSAASPLIHFASGQVAGMEMPPAGEGRPLSAREISLLRAWIDQGADWSDSPEVPATELAVTVTPTLRWFAVHGNARKFQEHAWRPEGWSGGMTRATFEHWLDLDTKMTAEGALDLPGNYEFEFEVTRHALGFLSGGAEQFRRYYNDYGGYYAPFDGLVEPAFRLDRDLHLDVGRAWMELGMRRPDWPEITLGYEYRYRNGEKSSLWWGPSTQGGETRNIYPAFKEMDEHVHLLTADLRYDWEGLELENNFLAEFTDLEVRGFGASGQNVDALPNVFSSTREDYDAFQLTNTFSLQKEVTDLLLLSGGYYYSYLDADASFALSTVDGGGAAVVGDHWFSHPVVLDWQAHIFSVGSRWGPWKDLTVSAGMQSEWQRQDAIGTNTLFFGLPDPLVPVPPFFVSRVGSSKQSTALTEHLAVRYSGLPATVLFAEAELEHGVVDYFEQDSGDLQGFVRDTESSSRDQEYRIGFNLSPAPRVSLASYYRYFKGEDRYDHRRDELLGGAGPNVGYSAFIRGRDHEMHELRTRLNVRVSPWLQTLFTYQLQSSDYHTKTDSVAFGIPSDTPGGWLLAGEHDAAVYGLNVTATPIERVSLSAALSYHDSRTRTGSNGDPAVDDFEGDIYSARVSGAYRIGDHANLSAHYSFTTSDFAQGNAAGGLPLGIEFEHHLLQIGISTPVGEKARVALQYSLHDYEESTSGGLNDYTAHGVFADCTLSW